MFQFHLLFFNQKKTKRKNEKIIEFIHAFIPFYFHSLFHSLEIVFGIQNDVTKLMMDVTPI